MCCRSAHKTSTFHTCPVYFPLMEHQTSLFDYRTHERESLPNKFNWYSHSVQVFPFSGVCAQIEIKPSRKITLKIKKNGSWISVRIDGGVILHKICFSQKWKTNIFLRRWKEFPPMWRVVNVRGGGGRDCSIRHVSPLLG